MASHPTFDKTALEKFEADYDTSHEDTALRMRGQFIKKFPRSRLRDLTLDEYVVGHQEPSFCNFVESKTRAWANIQGATSRKFGIYFGRTKTNPHREYRFTEKFGKTKEEAFEVVKAALRALVKLASEPSPDFVAIDANPLSQMFKAKILSLYFPERFLAVCSSEHLEMLGSITGFQDGLPYSQYQNLLLEAKDNDKRTRPWTEPKFMAFLYKTYVRSEQTPEHTIRKPRAKSLRLVDFDEMQKQRGEIGRRAEEYALAWEKERLVGARLGHLIDRIQDRRNRPGYGHDFLSHNTDKEPRYIEVKSVAKLHGGYRFVLSDNEHATSQSGEYSKAYYFYLVFFGGNGQPVDLIAVIANQLYLHAEKTSASYLVRFDLKHFAKNH